MREEAEEEKRAGGPYGLIAAEAGEEIFDEAGAEEGEEAGVTGEEAGEKGGFKKDRDEEKSRGDPGHPENGERDGDGEEDDLLVGQSGGEAEEKGVEEIEGVHRIGGLEEGDRDDDDHADEDVEVEVEGAEGLLKGLADRPEEPEEDKEEDGVGGGGRDKDEGEGAPPFPLEDEGGFQFQDGEEAGRSEVEEPAGGVHGDEAPDKVRDRPAAEAFLEKIGPTGGAHGAGAWSGLNGDFFPVQMLGVGVLFEILLKHDEDGADHGRIVLEADLGDEVGNDVEQAVGIDNGEGGGGGGGVGNVLVGAFGEVLDDVGEEFELLDEMGKLRGVDLGELGLQHGQAVEKIMHDLRGDPRGPALGESGNFSHVPRVTESSADGKRTQRWILKKGGARFWR